MTTPDDTLEVTQEERDAAEKAASAAHLDGAWIEPGADWRDGVWMHGVSRDHAATASPSFTLRLLAQLSRVEDDARTQRERAAKAERALSAAVRRLDGLR